MLQSFYKKIFAEIFRVITYLYIRINHIDVIAITGSLGKTMTRVAIGQFIKDEDFYVPVEGYNTEIGTPLAVFKLKTPDNITSPFSWLKLLFTMIGKLFKKADYRRIVLEMSADRPGDIKFLASMARPKVAVVTNVSPAHLKEFVTIENIAKEKGYLVESLPKNGVAILNADNKYVRIMRARTKAKKIMIGEDKSADIRWEKLVFKPRGMNFVLVARGQKYQVKTSIIAPQLLTSILSAFAVGLTQNMEVRELINAIENLKPEKGRMNIIKGIEETTLIDDSYNSSPDSLKAALEVLKNMPGRKVALLGSMNELGEIEKKSHKDLGKLAAESADVLITVGELANQYLAPEFEKLNKKSVQKFDNSTEAGQYLKSIIEKGDIVLFKGSQNNIYVEEAIKPLLPESVKAEDVLVRQSKMWEDKKRKALKESNG